MDSTPKPLTRCPCAACLADARDAIARDDRVIYDVAADCGQHNWADDDDTIDDGEIVEIRVTGKALKDARALLARVEGSR